MKQMDDTGRAKSVAALVSALEQAVPPGVVLATVDAVATAAIVVCESMGVPRGVWQSLTGDTVTYYRRLGLVSSPRGRTVKSQYRSRHVVEVIGARLVGSSVRVMTLGEAADRWKTMSDDDLMAQVAELVEMSQAFHAPRPLADARPTSETVAGVVRGTVVQAGSAQILLPLGYPGASVVRVARLVARIVEAGERSDAEIAEMERQMDTLV